MTYVHWDVLVRIWLDPTPGREAMLTIDIHQDKDTKICHIIVYYGLLIISAYLDHAVQERENLPWHQGSVHRGHNDRNALPNMRNIVESVLQDLFFPDNDILSPKGDLPLPVNSLMTPPDADTLVFHLCTTIWNKEGETELQSGYHVKQLLRKDP